LGTLYHSNLMMLNHYFEHLCMIHRSTCMYLAKDCDCVLFLVFHILMRLLFHILRNLLSIYGLLYCNLCSGTYGWCVLRWVEGRKLQWMRLKVGSLWLGRQWTFFGSAQCWYNFDFPKGYLMVQEQLWHLFFHLKMLHSCRSPHAENFGFQHFDYMLEHDISLLHFQM